MFISISIVLSEKMSPILIFQGLMGFQVAIPPMCTFAAVPILLVCDPYLISHFSTWWLAGKFPRNSIFFTSTSVTSQKDVSAQNLNLIALQIDFIQILAWEIQM